MTAAVNRFRFTEKYIKQIKNFLKGSAKTKPTVLNKFKGELKGNTLYIDGKRVVAKEDIDKYLREKIYDAKTPLSRDSAYYLISKETAGIPRSAVERFLRKQRIVRETDNQQPTTKRGSRKVFKSGQYHLDLIEIKFKDLDFEPDEIKKDDAKDAKEDDDEDDDDDVSKGYILSMVDALTSLSFFKFHPHKTIKEVTPIVKEALGWFRSKNNVPYSKAVIISDRGKEFDVKKYQSWGVRTRYVKTSAIVEGRNSFFQRTLRIGKMKKTKDIRKLVKMAQDITNNTRSKVSKKTPNENVKEKESDVSKRYNKKRGPDTVPRIKALKKGDKVRIQLLGAKDKGIGYKAYKSILWGKTIHTVQARRGQRYKVNNKFYHRDQLRLTPPADKESEKLLSKRQTEEHKKEDEKLKKVRKEIDTQPRRRSTRAASKRATQKIRASTDKWKKFDRKHNT